MKKLVVGILAHVDAGKTTLSESMLYLCKSIRKLGRVDNKDAFLDTYALEKERGITIFSKQAMIHMPDVTITLMDTPGHIDFSTETERTLQILDYAILVISGADGVQSHTKTLWQLLKQYKVPVFIFVNKMDQPGTNRTQVLMQLKQKLNENCCEMSNIMTEEMKESIAVCDESLMEHYLATDEMNQELIKKAIYERKLFLCYFGSALKQTNVDQLLEGLQKYTYDFEYPEEFGAKIYKIGRDEQGNRMTYLKVTGGTIKVKMVPGAKEEKINQIRIYSGAKYETVSEAGAGTVCAVLGLSDTHAGEGLGKEPNSFEEMLTPVLSYRIILPKECNPLIVLPKLKELEEEDPMLSIEYNEATQEIYIKIMGQVQTEIIQNIMKQRYGFDISFGEESIVYRETIANTVEGVGHFEPLRHYAEVHLLMEPLPVGSGLVFESDCREEVLARNWQRLIMTHLMEHQHIGVLIGAPITDMKITLVNARAHIKHTQGGDFREATYRAVRQGLKQAESVLLEPYYNFVMDLPKESFGKAVIDIERMNGTMDAPDLKEDRVILTGYAPVIMMRNYQKEITAYTKGTGRLECTLKGYAPCHNASEVIAASGYDSETDFYHPTGSVFCSKGSGFLVPWDQVKDFMHLECKDQENPTQQVETIKNNSSEIDSIGTEEIDQIISKTFYSNRKENNSLRRPFTKKAVRIQEQPVTRVYAPKEKQQEYLLVDGYNVIFSNEEMQSLTKNSMDAAKGLLMDLLCNYQAVKQCEVILVFDAYQRSGHQTEVFDYHNIHVVYTKEAETADQYIEKFAHQNSTKYKVTVATSDGLEQVIIRSKGCLLLSARDLIKEMSRMAEENKEAYKKKTESMKNYLFDSVTEPVSEHIKNILHEGKSN